MAASTLPAGRAMINREALPWVLALIIIFILMMLLSIVGYDNWSDLR